MKITHHAIKRYKERFGKRTTSGHNVKKHIRNKIKNSVELVYRDSGGSLNIVTDEFRAIIVNGVVTTITYKYPIRRESSNGVR